jgi:tetracenomycin A2 monooxygenase-dioxygenase
MVVEIIAKVPWVGAQLVAERFWQGRVFLVGDAAHVHPPAGGFGANTGIHDAHNLTWKLAAVLRGWAGPELLVTYDAERRPLGMAMADQAFFRNRIRHGHATQQDHDAMVDDIVITLGYRYRPTAVVPAESSEFSILTRRLQLTGQPGTRAPHVWLERESERISTLDLFWDAPVVLAGADGGPWIDAAAKVAKETGVPLRGYRIGATGDLRPVDRDWAEAYGVSSSGMALIRPDAFVASRVPELVASPEAVLERVVRRTAGLAPQRAPAAR